MGLADSVPEGWCVSMSVCACARTYVRVHSHAPMCTCVTCACRAVCESFLVLFDMLKYVLL